MLKHALFSSPIWTTSRPFAWVLKKYRMLHTGKQHSLCMGMTPNNGQRYATLHLSMN